MNYDQARQAVRYLIVEYTSGKGIEFTRDGRGPMFDHFLGMTRESGLNIIADNSLNFIMSAMPREINVKRWWGKIKYGGCLILVDGGELTGLMKTIKGWDRMVNQKVGDVWLRVYRKLIREAPNRASSDLPKTGQAKTACVVRHGGLGDMIQVAGVLKHLKKEGYHVTLITDAFAVQAVAADPHVDKFIVLDKGQLPPGELGHFWAAIKPEYDRFINLVESTEGALLTLPDRMHHQWPGPVLHEYMDKNYSEWIHKIAEVPLSDYGAFYWTNEEKKWAKKERKSTLPDSKIESARPTADKNRIRQTSGGQESKILLWSMVGSAAHKTYPYMDKVIDRIMEELPDWYVLLVGEQVCHEWVNRDRVIRKSGIWTIRQAFTFACVQADLVIGPETGIMNAVAHEPAPKIVFLSHSSIENLTKHWVNTTSLTPENCDCYPCHRIHYGWEFCRQDPKTACAACQADISADRVMGAIHEYAEVV